MSAPRLIGQVSTFAIVKVKETNDDFRKERTDVLSFSSTGAVFYLQRQVPVGRLVSIIMPLPAEKRSYDQDKELYRVWGLVQHCNISTSIDHSGYQTGVAFIGKTQPESYRTDPTTNYRISGVTADGLWKIKEAEAPFQTRRHVRYWKSIDLYLAVVDTQNETSGGEKATTENISQSGAAVISDLNVNIGDRVKFISEAYDFSGLAVVCNRQTGDDNRTRLHLEFVETAFPVENISFQNVAAN